MAVPSVMGSKAVFSEHFSNCFTKCGLDACWLVSHPSPLQDLLGFLALLLGILWGLLCPFLAWPAPLVPLASASPGVTYWEVCPEKQHWLGQSYSPMGTIKAPSCQAAKKKKKKAAGIGSQRIKAWDTSPDAGGILIRHAKKSKKS